MSKILIKAVKPHRQKILTEGGEEMRLQQWANKQAASALRGAGGDASGEQFTQSRDKLMRDALMNPDEHGIKFLGGKPVMFDDMQQPEAEEPMSEPMETESAPSMPDQSLFDEKGNLRTSMPSEKKRITFTNTTQDNSNYHTTLDTPKPEDDDDEPSFLDFYKKSFQKAVRSRVASFRDAWSVLKQQ